MSEEVKVGVGGGERMPEQSNGCAMTSREAAAWPRLLATPLLTPTWQIEVDFPDRVLDSEGHGKTTWVFGTLAEALAWARLEWNPANTLRLTSHYDVVLKTHSSKLAAHATLTEGLTGAKRRELRIADAEKTLGPPTAEEVAYMADMNKEWTAQEEAAKREREFRSREPAP